jgi:MFS transporter, DHA1 family, multidrug resistance protein
MYDFLRDTFFGSCVRLASGNRLFQYPEEQDPTIWERYIDAEKSASMARYGKPMPPGGAEQDQRDAKDPSQQARLRDSRTSSATQVFNETHDALFNGNKRHVDPEKGKDSYIVSWYGDNDPEVSQSLSPHHPSRPNMLTWLHRTLRTGLSQRSSSSPSRSAS